jgi:hypothetical protein
MKDFFRNYMFNILFFSTIFIISTKLIDDKLISNLICMLCGLLIGLSIYKYWIFDNLYKCTEANDDVYYLMSTNKFNSMINLLNKITF